MACTDTRHMKVSYRIKFVDICLYWNFWGAFNFCTEGSVWYWIEYEIKLNHSTCTSIMKLYSIHVSNARNDYNYNYSNLTNSILFWLKSVSSIHYVPSMTLPFNTYDMHTPTHSHIQQLREPFVAYLPAHRQHVKLNILPHLNPGPVKSPKSLLLSDTSGIYNFLSCVRNLQGGCCDCALHGSRGCCNINRISNLFIWSRHSYLYNFDLRCCGAVINHIMSFHL